MKKISYCTGAFLSIIFLLSVPDSVSAGVLRQFAMYFSDGMKAEQCALVERSTGSKKKPNSYTGQLQANECLVTMPLQEYEARFQFCYLSGFNLYKVTDSKMIECVIQQRGDEYMFSVNGAISGEGVEQVMCYFSCIGVKGK